MPLSKLCVKKKKARKIPSFPPTCGPTLRVGAPLSPLLTVLNRFCMTRTYEMLLEDIRKDARSCQKQQRVEGRWVKREHCSEECALESVRAPGAEGKTCLYAASLQKYLHELRMNSDRPEARGANRVEVIMWRKRRDDVTNGQYGHDKFSCDVFIRTLADEAIMFMMVYRVTKLKCIVSPLCSRVSDASPIPAKARMCAAL